MASTPAIDPHPSPPHASPQTSGQHTSVSWSWTPARPLSHSELLDAAAGNTDRRDGEASECVGLTKGWVSCTSFFTSINGQIKVYCTKEAKYPTFGNFYYVVVLGKGAV